MKVEHQYIIFCDESERDGKYYSNFYGGVIVSAKDYEKVTKRLDAKKKELNFYGEVKWEKVSASPYLEKYVALVQAFFEEVRAGASASANHVSSKCPPSQTPVDRTDGRCILSFVLPIY